MAVTFDIASLSRTGGRRANEDYADFLQTAETSCWVLADGLGGHRGGAVASKTVVEAALASFRNRPEVSVDAVHAHVAHAQAVLMAAQAQDPSLAQMRSTIVVLVSGDRDAVWGHVGDSRLYHVRGGQIVERTRDHSVSQALVDGGQIDAHDQGAHEDRSRLLRCLGKDADTTAAVSGPHALARGDAFLICTDGFWEALDDTSMELDFAGADDATAWLDRLEARLRRQIGPTHDNYTATAVRITSDVPAPAVPHDPRRPIQAPWRQADEPRPPRADADVDDAVGTAAGGVLASVRLRVARLTQARPTTLAAAAVLMLALVATGVWHRHALAAWVKAVVSRHVRHDPPQQPLREQPADPSKGEKPNAKPTATPPKDEKPTADPPADGEKPADGSKAAPPESAPSAAPPAEEPPVASAPSAVPPRVAKPPAAKGVGAETTRNSRGKKTPRPDADPSSKGAETPRSKP